MMIGRCNSKRSRLPIRSDREVRKRARRGGLGQGQGGAAKRSGNGGRIAIGQLFHLGAHHPTDTPRAGNKYIAVIIKPNRLLRFLETYERLALHSGASTSASHTA